jgi:cytochrome P450
MSSVVTADVPYGFDLQSPSFLADPYPIYARMRAEAPVAYIEPRFVVSSYEDVAAMLRDPRFGRAGFDGFMQQVFGPGPLFESFRRSMLFLDPPDHTRLRGLATRAFTPRAVERLRTTIRTLVDGLLDDLGADGGGDLVSRFAYPLPMQVICEMLGVPPDDREEFRIWTDAIGRSLQFNAMTPEILADGNEAADRLTEYFRSLVAERRVQPRDDLLGALIAAEDETGRLSEDELLATAILLFVAGHETTVNLIANGTLALLRHPDQWQLLHDDPSLVRLAVEELLRYESPVQFVSRVALADAEIGGVSIPAGVVVAMITGSANRDPDRFPDPDRLDIRRTDNQHLAFAAGPHYCLGAALARVEGEIAFAALVQRYPDLKLATDTVIWRKNIVLRGVQALPVTC